MSRDSIYTTNMTPASKCCTWVIC